MRKLLTLVSAIASVAMLRKVTAMGEKISDQLNKFYTRLDNVTNEIAEDVRSAAGTIQAQQDEINSLKTKLGESQSDNTASQEAIDKLNGAAEKLEVMGSNPNTPLPPSTPGGEPEPGPVVDESNSSGSSGNSGTDPNAAKPEGAILDDQGKLAENQDPATGTDRRRTV
jgi:FtsZ-binding cell division protein ZapB